MEGETVKERSEPFNSPIGRHTTALVGEFRRLGGVETWEENAGSGLVN